MEEMKKTIVFINKDPMIRVYNQAMALKKTKKYKTILVCRAMDRDNLQLFKKVFDSIIFYQPLDLHYPLLRILRKIPFPLSYPVNSINWALEQLSIKVNWALEQLIIKQAFPKIIKYINANFDVDLFYCIIPPYWLGDIVMKNTSKPVAIDACDYYSIEKSFENLTKDEYEKEKYLFEHADGILHRGPQLEIDYLQKYYNITCPTLSHLDYCNREFFAKDCKKISCNTNELHVVHIGSVDSPHFLQFVKAVAKQKTHFHIYPLPNILYPMISKEFLKLCKREKYVHLEKTIAYDTISHEITKYDFGVHISFLNLKPLYFKTVTPYRFFKYLEAGLPIIVNEQLEMMKKWVTENGIGFSVKDEDFENINKIIEKHDYEELTKNVLRMREKLLIDNHIKELEEFYERSLTYTKG